MGGGNFKVHNFFSLTPRSKFNILFRNVCRQLPSFSFKIKRKTIIAGKSFTCSKKREFWKLKCVDLVGFIFFLIRRDQWTHTIRMATLFYYFYFFPLFFQWDKHWVMNGAFLTFSAAKFLMVFTVQDWIR